MKDKIIQNISLYLYPGARIVLGLVFIYASYDKLLHPAAFAKIIYNYQILPNELINLSAIFLPWLELATGCLLLSGVWLPGSVFISNVLLILFFCVLIYNKARGLDISCGCFSTSSKSISYSNLYIIRDAAFIIIANYLFIKVFISPTSSAK
ncbi:MAG: DoxX family membrane protein [Desulfobacterium sp.]|nr:DoxX family membrane protein [Desulfobacterium sp.]MBU3947245.1 DoxX family membrane protein [Pseudomonadota bacterium]MBU4036505.1 DoxX family membrane protein [Pseudomonadota bacterium]